MSDVDTAAASLPELVRQAQQVIREDYSTDDAHTMGLVAHAVVAVWPALAERDAEVVRLREAVERVDKIAETLVRCPDPDVQRYAEELHVLAALSSLPETLESENR